MWVVKISGAGRAPEGSHACTGRQGRPSSRRACAGACASRGVEGRRRLQHGGLVVREEGEVGVGDDELTGLAEMEAAEVV